VIVGAPSFDNGQTNEGRVFVYLSASVRGDMNEDRTVDESDFLFIAPCLDAPGVPRDIGCARADINRDGSVDLKDFAAFQNVFGK